MLNTKRLLIVLLMLGLVACGSTPDKSTKPKTVTNVETPKEVILEEDPDYYLQQAQREFATSSDGNIRDQWIMRAVEAYKQQGNCNKSKTILKVALPEMTDPILRDQAKLVVAECLVKQDKIDYAVLDTLLNEIQHVGKFNNRYAPLKVQYLVHQNRWLDAAKVRASFDQNTPETSLDIWYLLQNLSESQQQKAKLSESELQPWLELSLIVQRYGLDSAALNTAVTNWQQRNNNHPLALELPAEVSRAITLERLPREKVAILLPLSGRLAQQGMAIKNGILSAYFAAENNETRIRFIDTQTKDAQQLVELTADYDIVIGPLMKDELSEFVKLSSTSDNILGLNRVDIAPIDIEIATSSTDLAVQTDLEEPLQPGVKVFFALSPEDEAAQLAEKVYSTGVIQPIVVAQQSGASRRMAEEFLNTWQLLTDKNAIQPSLATFEDNAAMRNSVSEQLDVLQSNARIKEIEFMTSKQIYSVPRNRRDIDAIVVFASPEQTELLNPMIEASLSPFNQKVVPVYGSSRSFSLNFTNNSLRDLRNLIFTEMPWMLPDHQWQQIANEVDNLWPEKNDTLRRLFALGFDAFNLTAVMKNLQTLPQISMSGMTGNISIDGQGNVMRVLPVGHITENKVTLFALD